MAVTARPRLDPAYLALAIRLQEADAGLYNDDVAARLRDAIADQHRGSGTWAYYITHRGDDQSGEVIYSCDSDTISAPYEMSAAAGGAAKCIIDFEAAEDVVPRTIYEKEMDEEDHYAAMEESYRRDELYTGLPIYERYISKKTRDSMSSEDFAGKGKSFPIQQPGDIMAAVRSMGRAGSKNLGPSGIKARIIAIAKRKGWTKYLPKSWRSDTSTSESASALVRDRETLRLVESGEFCAVIPIAEAARTSYPIRIISPGTGTKAHYPADVLAREASKFKPGTLMFWNHPTALEESQRPEGDLDNLAAILTSEGRWEANGVKGPGIYAEAKVMADYAEKVAERAPHIGVSIRGGGIPDGNKTIDGKPVLKSFDYIESVDYVTKAGRGGLALAEAARNAGLIEEESMTEADFQRVQQLVEAAITKAIPKPAAPTEPDMSKAVRALETRALRGDATVEASRVLASVSLRESVKALIVENCLRGDLPVKEGALDADKFKELVTAEAQRIGAALGDGGRVTGMGPTTPAVSIDAKEAERREAARKNEHENNVRIFESLGMPKDAAERAVRGRVA
jgi:hypothetical protein